MATTSYKELLILALVARITALMEAEYPGAFIISRKTSIDPKAVPAHSVFIMVQEGAASPVEGAEWNARVLYESPLLVSLRVACPDEDSDNLQSEMNAAEALILGAFAGEPLTQDFPSGYEVRGAQREITKNEIWTDVEITLRHPVF